MIKYGFVILHYLAYDMTLECVSLLLERYGSYDIHVVIVDNASPNGSGRQLLDHYKEDSRVTVLLNPENAGFAKGNNVGYQYLNEHVQPDYIIVMNNDVLIDQPDFLDIVDEISHRTRYAVLGPDIYCPPRKKHQNPEHIKAHNRQELEMLCRKLSRYCKYSLFYYIRNRLHVVARRLIHQPERSADGYEIESQEDIILFGACYIFSRDFIEKRSLCFCPDTFMYGEEDILHWECKQLGLKMVYSPYLKVRHMSQVATKKAIRNDYAKYKMEKMEALRSFEAWLRLMPKDY